MITLYTTHCPQCNILEKKLESKGIVYKECNDQELMLKLGMLSVPWLEVDGKAMNFTQANQWINEQEAMFEHYVAIK